MNETDFQKSDFKSEDLESKNFQNENRQMPYNQQTVPQPTNFQTENRQMPYNQQTIPQPTNFQTENRQMPYISQTTPISENSVLSHIPESKEKNVTNSVKKMPLFSLRPTVTSVCLCVILIIAVIFEFCVGVSPLFAKIQTVPLSDVTQLEKGMYVEGKVYFSTDEYYMVKHTINFIPSAYEHYYLIYCEDLEQLILLRADSNWADNFDEDGFNPDGVKVSGVLKEMDYKMKQEVFADFNDYNSGAAISVYYLDNISVKYAIYTLINAVIYVAAVLVFIFCKKSSNKPIFNNFIFRMVCMIIVFVNLIFSVHILSMY